jgi:hypothetical protein
LTSDDVLHARLARSAPRGRVARARTVDEVLSLAASKAFRLIVCSEDLAVGDTGLLARLAALEERPLARVAVVCAEGAGDWFGEYVRGAHTLRVDVEEEPLDDAGIERLLAIARR